MDFPWDRSIQDPLESQANTATAPEMEIAWHPAAEIRDLQLLIPGSNTELEVQAPRATPIADKPAKHSRVSSISKLMSRRRRTSTTASVSEALMQSTSVAYGATMPTIALWDADSRNVE
jgi:hypothetical protein